MADAPKPKKKREKDEDVVFVHSPTPDGEGWNVLRKRAERLEIGAIRAVEEGKPLHGEVVRLSARDDSPRLFDVDVQYAPEAPLAAERGGPAQVASDQYRKGWDAVFGPARSRRPRSTAN